MRSNATPWAVGCVTTWIWEKTDFHGSRARIVLLHLNILLQNIVKTLVIVDDRNAMRLAGWQMASADEYLSEHAHTVANYDAVVNLCATERYQGKGFYVSLVAEARGHQPLPSIKAIEDLHSAALPGLLEPELAEVMGDVFAGESGNEVQIAAYFGRDRAGRYEAIAQRLFQLVKAPLLSATFSRKSGHWHLASLDALPVEDVLESELPLLCDAIERHFNKSRQLPRSGRTGSRRAIAILYEGRQADSPSNDAALTKFVAAGKALDMQVEVVDRTVDTKLAGFDGLFIRETTHLNHYTYDLARKATALGKVVIDDPDSILQCNNKVYLHELLTRYNIPMPKSITVHRGNVDQIIPVVGLPCVLKLPDGAFSLGVSKVEHEDELHAAVAQLLLKSDLIIAQAFQPTAFDWRVGMLDGRPLFVCRYFMAPNHWQVIKRDYTGRTEGQTTAIAIGEAPSEVIRTATRAANLIGSGFYGVDLKETDTGCFVMEVNDNPNVDAGNEDGVLQDALYREVMSVMKRSIVEEGLRLPTRQTAAA
jgi:glutathione synthase/RimK-type ligase-like ATP-grasp enzyme